MKVEGRAERRTGGGLIDASERERSLKRTAGEAVLIEMETSRSSRSLSAEKFEGPPVNEAVHAGPRTSIGVLGRGKRSSSASAIQKSPVAFKVARLPATATLPSQAVSRLLRGASGCEYDRSKDLVPPVRW